MTEINQGTLTFRHYHERHIVNDADMTLLVTQQPRHLDLAGQSPEAEVV